MENAEEIFQSLDDFSKRKPKIIPRELEDYLAYVARTGDPVYQWPLVKCLFKEKLLNVITDFYENSQSIDIPHCPNVDPFNYDAMKNSLIERVEAFSSAPFTVQRICELLTAPNKQYNRIDKFMRAIEKNVLVVSTREPGVQRHTEHENGDSIGPMLNGSDSNSDYNVDVEMEDMSWKENHEAQARVQPQPSSSETQPLMNDVEGEWMQNKPETSSPEKKVIQYESVTPPNISCEESLLTKPEHINENTGSEMVEDIEKTDSVTPPDQAAQDDPIEKTDSPITEIVVIPEINIEPVEEGLKLDEEEINENTNSKANETDNTESMDHSEVSEDPTNKITEEAPIKVPTEVNIDKNDAEDNNSETHTDVTPKDVATLNQSEESNSSVENTDEVPINIPIESNSEENAKDNSNSKSNTDFIPTSTTVVSSGEESSSSSDNTDGNSNSPKNDNEVNQPQEPVQ